MQHSIYLHIPFCTHRCAYCDFNTYAWQERYIGEYTEALCREVRHVGSKAPKELLSHTVFFGGGTPSLLSVEQVVRVMEAVRVSLRLVEDAEITLEANPGTVAARSLRGLRDGGVNRLSLGVQSANGEELRMLERTHSFADVLGAVSAARAAGIDNLSLDLIFGLPEQAMHTWQTTVERILRLKPEHISAYALTLEHGTPFGSWANRGLLAAPDPDLAADMYEWLAEKLQAEGYEQYEISNWARPGRECIHNLQYWRGGPYLGFGAGAHGYAHGYRYSNVLAIPDYLDRICRPRHEDRTAVQAGTSASLENAERGPRFPLSPAAIEHHRQRPEDDMTDFMIMGLRLTKEGIDAGDFQRRFGRGLLETYGAQISELLQHGLLERAEVRRPGHNAGDRAAEDGNFSAIRLTSRGRLLGNRVFAAFVG